MLIVEDFADNRELLTEYLTFRGFTVDAAADGAAAIRMARADRPDVILMDLRMPGLDGWEATRRLKADPSTAAVPVVAVTAHALRLEIDSARNAGCDAVVAKPFDIAALADALESFRSRGVGVFERPGLALKA
ncbi:MAG TPA: response regulator [Vicinamibacterales bacterium]|nr:response regulator [Vicinamibacterales bacterium]